MISKLLVKYPEFEKHTFSSLEGNAHTLMHTYSCIHTHAHRLKIGLRSFILEVGYSLVILLSNSNDVCSSTSTCMSLTMYLLGNMIGTYLFTMD